MQRTASEKSECGLTHQSPTRQQHESDAWAMRCGQSDLRAVHDLALPTLNRSL